MSTGKTGRVKITLLFAAVLFQCGLLDFKKYAVKAQGDSEAKEDTTSGEKEDTDGKKDTEDQEDADPQEDTDEKGDPDEKKEEEISETVAEGDCPRPFFREYCSEEKPCCLYQGGNYACQKVMEEGENCTQNAFAYNTRDCFCKQGLFCVDGKCTSKTPQKQKVEEF